MPKGKKKVTDDLAFGDLSAAADAGRRRVDPREADKEERSGGRQLLGGFSLNLGINGTLDPAFHYHYFKNDGKRVQAAMAAGYRPVVNDETSGYNVNVAEDSLADQGQWEATVTGRLEGGQPQVSYLMAIPIEFYEQDQATKQKGIDAIDQAILGNELTPNEGDAVTYHNANIQNNFKR